MNEFLQFILFSTLEYFSVIFVALCLWGFSTKRVLKIIFLSILYACVSYVFREYKLDSLSPVYTLLITMIVFRYFYKAKFLYSFLISLSGYLIAAITQGVIVGMLIIFKISTLNDLQPFSVIGHILQIATFIIVVIMGIKIKVSGNVFSFIPEEKYKLKNPVYSNKILFILSAFVIIFITSTFSLIYISKENSMIYLFLIILALSISTLLFLLYKRDGEEFGHLQ